MQYRNQIHFLNLKILQGSPGNEHAKLITEVQKFEVMRLEVIGAHGVLVGSLKYAPQD